MSDATIDYDALDFFRGTETVADPYPYFDWLRAQCPVHREPQHGVYMVTGYEEACRRLRRRRHVLVLQLGHRARSRAFPFRSRVATTSAS